MIIKLENDLGIIPLFFNVSPHIHPFLSPPPFVTSSQLADLGGRGAGEPRWLTRRLNFAAASWCKLRCFLIGMAAAAAGKTAFKAILLPQMSNVNNQLAKSLTDISSSPLATVCKLHRGFLYIQSSWLLLMSTALTFSWTSKNNCRTAGTKVYKYQRQFINTELRVIIGLTNIKLERMKRCRQEII